MARPIKYGVDFIPVMTEITQEERLVLAEMGLKGMVIYSIAMRSIARRGYYIELNDLIWVELSEILRMPVNEIKEFLTGMAKKGIFDENLLKKGILTGRGIQAIMLDLYKRLKRTKVEEKYRIEEKEERSSVKKNEKVKRFEESSEAYQVSKKLYENIIEMNPSHRKPDLQKWSEEADKMMRIDKREYGEVMEMLEYLKSDDFWKKNILSTLKLREHYDKIKIKKDSSEKGKFTKPSKFTNRKVVKL